MKTLAVLLLAAAPCLSNAHGQGHGRIVSIQASCLEWGLGFGDPYTVLVTELNMAGDRDCMLWVFATLRDGTLRRLDNSEFTVATDFGLSYSDGIITALSPTWDATTRWGIYVTAGTGHGPHTVTCSTGLAVGPWVT